MANKKTYSQRTEDVSREWYSIDADGKVLGRLATTVASKLIGKDKPTYTPHVDNGDYVIVTNVDKIVTTGTKELSKKYYSHSGYPGGIKETSLKKLLEEAPEKVLIKAVKGMIPKNKLADGRMARLKLYIGEAHEHEAQKPKEMEMN